MGKLKVVLAVPNFRWAPWDVNTLWHYTPVGLCLLAAVIEEDCDVSILDANKKDMSREQFVQAMADMAPDVVGITVLMDQYAEAGHEAAKMAKAARPGAKVILGGVYATMNPEKAIQDPNLDYVVIGEGEYVLKQMIGFLKGENGLPMAGVCYRENGRIVNRGHSEFIQDLDALPLPAYHLIDFQAYASGADRKSVDSPPAYPFAHMFTSRGCPFGCSFCQVEAIMGSKFRARSAKSILAEISWLKKTYGIKSIIFEDDNLYTSAPRAREIFQGMIDLGLVMPWVSISTAVFRLDEGLIKLMRRSGCQYINIAIESGTERVRKEIIGKPVDFQQAKAMVKIARTEGIYVAANFIVGFPTETWDEIRQTIRFAEEIDVDYIKLYALIPFKKTRLWGLCVEHKAFKPGFDEEERRWSTGQLESKYYTANDLTILRAFEWDRVNFTDPAKRDRTARIMGIAEDELLQIRRRTLDNACRLVAEGTRAGAGVSCRSEPVVL